MARRRRQPLAFEAAEGITTLWTAAFALLVVLPESIGSAVHLTPLAQQELGLGALAMLASWWWAIRTLQAQRARGKRLEELQGMTPAAFEEWVGARFRERGHTVQVTGTHGTGGDHGIDLVAKKRDETAVVQVKKFITKSVGEPMLRDLYGAMHAVGAGKAYLVTTGQVTEAAREWAKGKPLEIWDADAVTRISLEIAPSTRQAANEIAAPDATALPSCSKCGAATVKRLNRRTGELFLGCSTFPSCRHTIPLV